MIGWAEAVPQIAVAIAIIAVAILLIRQLVGLAKLMTRPGVNGKRESRLEAIEGTVKKHGDALQSHGKMLRKQFAGISTLRTGQLEILEHLTNGPSTTSDIPLDIDAADTGEYQAYEGD